VARFKTKGIDHAAYTGCEYSDLKFWCYTELNGKSYLLQSGDVYGSVCLLHKLLIEHLIALLSVIYARVLFQTGDSEFFPYAFDDLEKDLEQSNE
jgi:hypothetical protein